MTNEAYEKAINIAMKCIRKQRKEIKALKDRVKTLEAFCFSRMQHTSILTDKSKIVLFPGFLDEEA